MKDTTLLVDVNATIPLNVSQMWDIEEELRMHIGLMFAHTLMRNVGLMAEVVSVNVIRMLGGAVTWASIRMVLSTMERWDWAEPPPGLYIKEAHSNAILKMTAALQCQYWWNLIMVSIFYGILYINHKTIPLYGSCRGDWSWVIAARTAKNTILKCNFPLL